MLGKPVIKGTRLTVELICEKLAAGETVAQLLEAHPQLTQEGIQAALDYASQTNKTSGKTPKKLAEMSEYQQIALEETAGIWIEERHPELKTEEDIDAWLRDLCSAY